MDFVTVSTCLNQAQADLMVAHLRAAGFPVLLHSEFAAALTATGEFRVQVPSDRVEDALALLASDESRRGKDQ